MRAMTSTLRHVLLALCCLSARAALSALPAAPLSLHGKFNPEYFRGLMGADLQHPWLKSTSAKSGGVGGVVDATLEAIDSDRNGSLSHKELVERAILSTSSSSSRRPTPLPLPLPSPPSPHPPWPPS